MYNYYRNITSADIPSLVEKTFLQTLTLPFGSEKLPPLKYIHLICLCCDSHISVYFACRRFDFVVPTVTAQKIIVESTEDIEQLNTNLINCFFRYTGGGVERSRRNRKTSLCFRELGRERKSKPNPPSCNRSALVSQSLRYRNHLPSTQSRLCQDL